MNRPPRSSLKPFLATAALMIALLACQGPELPAEPGTVLFQDDFALEISGWDRQNSTTYVSDYADGSYRIHVLTPNTDAWSNPHINLRDVQIEVDAAKSSGPDDNFFGVLCRYQDASNFYFLVASSDGYAGIGISKEGRRHLISGESMLPTQAIIQGNATNHLRADCIGYDLRLYLNGTLVAAGQAAEWPQGDVGLIVGTYEEPNADIVFDNFSVIKP